MTYFLVMKYIVGNNIGWNCKWKDFLCISKGRGRKSVVETSYGLVGFPVKVNENMLGQKQCYFSTVTAFSTLYH